MSEKLINNKKQLKTLNETIAVRKKYLVQQEKDIDSAISSYNTRLFELNADITTIENRKDVSLRELADYQSQVKQTSEEFVELSNKLIQLKNLYESTVSKYKIEIRELQAEKQRAESNRQHAINEASKIIKKISEKENELNIKEKILDERDKKQN